MKHVKTISKTLFISALLVMAASCKNNNKANTDHSEEGHKGTHDNQSMDTAMKVEFKDEKTAAVFQHYIHIKTALVNTDAEEAKSGGEMLGSVTDNEAIQTLASKIAQTDDIEAQRAAFSELTPFVTTILDGALSSGELYKQYCPMAFNNTGGYWLSKTKEIRNPYFGDKMLKCGTVEETLQ